MNLSPYSSENPAIGSRPALTGNPARDLANSFTIRFILFLLLHIPLALLMELSPWVSTIHAAAVLIYGLVAGLAGRTSRVIAVAGYIASCEVLWRMSQAHLVWEYAKYALVLLAFVALIAEWRVRGGTHRIQTVWPLLLMVVLIPGIVLTIIQVGLAETRDPVSFYLGSYLAMFMLILFLWARPVNTASATQLLTAIMAPVVGITFLAIYYTVRSFNEISFGTVSNWITSGSFGPNQVSNMMGLGALAGIMLFILIPRAKGAKLFILILTVVMLGQGLLTFSRGGIYSFLLGLAALGFHMLNNRRARGSFAVIFILITVLLIAGIYPFLDDITNGSLTDRFSELDTTGRFELAEFDIKIFLENPVGGVGVGQVSHAYEAYYGYPLSAHTEFTRLLAEHGLFGIIVIFILMAMLFTRYRANTPGLGRGMTAALAVWAFSIMVHSAMRLAAVSFTFSVAMVLWQLNRPDDLSVTDDSQSFKDMDLR